MAVAGQPKLIVEADAEALARAAAERVMARIAANPGRIAICLTGGSSPKKLYQLLGSDAYRDKIPWEREVVVDVLEFASKYCYVIADGAGYGAQIARIPINGRDKKSQREERRKSAYAPL